jgi:hypothetical protein
MIPRMPPPPPPPDVDATVASTAGVGDANVSAVRFAESRSGHGIVAIDAAVASNGEAVN